MSRNSRSVLLLCQALILTLLLILPATSHGDSVCTTTWTPDSQKAMFGKDIEVKGSAVCVGPGNYFFGFVNIHSGGQLIFTDANIHFWAKSILVENEGSLIAGSPKAPIGTSDIKNIVTIHLYGSESDDGIKCKTANCGAGADIWLDKGTTSKVTLPGSVNDYFYKYQNLPTYSDKSDGDFYFGRKVLAASYGAAVQLFGKKGATYSEQLNPMSLGHTRVLSYPKPLKKGDSHFDVSRFVDWKKGSRVLFLSKDGRKYETRTIGGITKDPNDFHTSLIIEDGLKSDIGLQGGHIVRLDPSGTSWARLDGSIKATDNALKVDREVGWTSGDRIVVTTTDYLPSHSEQLEIDSYNSSAKTITLKNGIRFPHNGEKYSLKDRNIPKRLTDDGFALDEVETRAAVALLSRNIRIVSEEGSSYDESKPEGKGLSTSTYFGGHTIVRQGVKQLQVQGVEFYQLGQGGRMAHSPVNFHMMRTAPANTFVKDCSVWDSMTRMYEVRGTSGVTLERNVGYKSIGHGYFIAEGAETGNTFRGNIGIYARPAIGYRDNDHQAPGIISRQNGYGDQEKDPERKQFLKFGGDYIHPSVFFIMNGYNVFEDNMAVGAGTCGSCYWFAPGVVSGLSQGQVWEGYANIQSTVAGTAPIKKFQGNFCSTAQQSLITIDTTGTCAGLNTPNLLPDSTAYSAVPNPFEDSYKGLYPEIRQGAVLQAMTCDDAQCTAKTKPCIKGSTENCVVNVIDSYTSSFHWAQQNFSAIWLRTNWFLMTDSVLTDIQRGGLTMVSGGSWDQVINKYWALTRKSAFIGHTQDQLPYDSGKMNHSYAYNNGPVNPDSGLKCQRGTPASYCKLTDEGVVLPSDTFGVYQRLYNIYDGPVYQEANVYHRIKKRPFPNCVAHGIPTGLCTDNGWDSYYRTSGIPVAKEDPYRNQCVFPNAAIGWKQPNGFYYPPAFHSRNLYFNDVDIRHFVIVPLFKPGTSEVDVGRVMNEYCTYPPGQPKELFANDFTDVDRQTELNDDDGTMSGLWGSVPKQLAGTISVNTDQFFDAPSQAMQCLSEQTCIQSPYDFVSAVVFPDSRTKAPIPCPTCAPAQWDSDCMNRECVGVPIYRQYLKKGETKGEGQGIRMMGAGIYQRSTMVANNGKYYIDTTIPVSKQKAMKNVFEKGRSYDVFLIYAKPETNVTFQVYVGKDLPADYKDSSVRMIRVGGLTDGGEGTTVLRTPLATNKGNWPGSWTRTYNPGTGILEVTMKMSGDDNIKQTLDSAPAETCGPKSFCQWQKKDDGSGMACRYVKDQKAIDFQGDDSICSWSVKDLECPSGGCYGFQFDLTTDVVTADDNERLARRPDPVDPNASALVVKTTDDLSKDPVIAQLDKSEPCTIDSVDNSGAVSTRLTLKNGLGSSANYTLVKRTKTNEWVWLKKGTQTKAGDTSVTLDRKVDWSSGDEILIATPGTCVYNKDNPPSIPAYVWDQVEYETMTLSGVKDLGGGLSEITLDKDIQHPENGYINFRCEIAACKNCSIPNLPVKDQIWECPVQANNPTQTWWLPRGANAKGNTVTVQAFDPHPCAVGCKIYFYPPNPVMQSVAK